MRRAELNGISLDFEDQGAGEPVVFVHGALIADAFLLLRREERLAERFRLITYRRRGYGASSAAAAGLTLREQAADCKALLDHLTIQRAHIAGHSFGGAIALQLALDAPSRVHSLTLLEPALMVGNSGEGYRIALQQVVQFYRDKGAETAVDAMLRARWPDYRDGLGRLMPNAFAQAVKEASATFESELPALLEWRFGEDEAHRITQPVLSVVGQESVHLSPRFGEAHEWLLSHLPAAEGYVLPNAHHFLQVENPMDMAEAFAAFLMRNPMSATWHE
jgi:pimeloyl-ACP methyl ester carboxylesterase